MHETRSGDARRPRVMRWAMAMSGLMMAIGCVSHAPPGAGPPSFGAAPDPTKRQEPLPAENGWNATLVIDNGDVGIWTVRAFPVFEAYGTRELVGLDDSGRCHVMVGYSGKWTPVDACHDGKWLGGLAHGDVDPRVPGSEIYTGGQKGNLYMVRGYENGVLDCRRISYFPGMEIHTVLAGDLDTTNDGAELLVYTRPGALYRVTPTGDHGAFESELVETLSGRVRDAVVLPTREGEAVEVLTASRNGLLEIHRFGVAGPEHEVVYRTEMGFGRLSLRPESTSTRTTVYVSQDDGCILRFERYESAWSHEVIYRGPQGPRGVAAGRFDADPAVETVAVFGYSGRVELLTRRDGGWTIETIFVDRDKGHWLTAAELDSRNATDELVGSGYGARIFLLSRPPAYGTNDRAATAPDG